MKPPRSDSGFFVSMPPPAFCTEMGSSPIGTIKKKGAAFASFFFVVPVVGLEPTRYRYQRILSPPRLPFQHTGV